MQLDQNKALVPNILFNAQTASYQEVKDSLIDAFRAARIVDGALKDGFQYSDLFAILGTEPIIKEIVNDAPEFLKQFKQLNGKTAKSALLEAKAVIEAEAPLGKAERFIFGFLYNVSTSFDFVQTTLMGYRIEKTQWDILFAGGNPIPEAI